MDSDSNCATSTASCSAHQAMLVSHDSWGPRHTLSPKTAASRNVTADGALQRSAAQHSITAAVCSTYSALSGREHQAARTVEDAMQHIATNHNPFAVHC